MSKFGKQILLLLVFFASVNAFTQNNTDSDLAEQYFNNKEFDKAQVYYEKLYNQTHSAEFYNNLLVCFKALNNFKEAEKLIKKQVKRFSYQLYYLVDLGNLYKINNDEKKANQTYNNAIKQLSPDNQQIVDLANRFVKYQEYDLAIETYLKGRKLLKGDYPFNFELAQVYNAQGKTELMLEEYLQVLSYQESYIQSVQNVLQTALNPDENGEKKALLKKLLIKNIQQNPNKTVYSEMLIWVYVQDKNFEGALIQAKALDKRNKESGIRIYNLAGLSLSNKDYDNAIACYEYIIKTKDADNFYYAQSKMELVNTYNKKIIETNNYTQQDLISLENNYNQTIKELGKTAASFPLLKGLAHLEAFYLHNTDKAINILNDIIALPRLQAHDQAEAKLELADVDLFIGQIWDASLLYSQVEQDFKYDQLGETAKFKNAKISFYTGDFAWAKIQIDVLKASNIAANIFYTKYQINYKLKNYDKAAYDLNQLIAKNGDNILADDAVFNLAQLYDNQLNDKQKAAELYKKILFDYKSSVYVIDARKRYRELVKTEDIKSEDFKTN